MYPIYIWFDSEFCPEFKLKILRGQIRSSGGQTLVKTVKLGSNRADKTKCTQHTYGSTPNFVQNTNSKFFEVKSGHQEVKLGSKPSNKGQIGPSSRNISKMHVFRLRILSRTRICHHLVKHLLNS